MAAASSNAATSENWWRPTACLPGWWRREDLSNRRRRRIEPRRWSELAGGSGAAPALLATDLGYFRLERGQQRLDPGLPQVVADQDQAAAAVFRGPTRQPCWRIKHVLDPVDHGRAIGAFGNLHQALEAQQVAAAVLGQRLEEQRQTDRPDRRFPHQRKVAE